MSDPPQNQSIFRRPIGMTVLRTLGFIFLILGLPIIIFLPSAFRMPTWWEPTIETLFLAGGTLLGALLAMIGTLLLLPPVLRWRQSTKHWAWIDFLRYCFLVSVILVVWYTVVMGAIQLVNLF